MIVISFAGKEIQFAEGLHMSPPTELHEVLIQVLIEYMSIPIVGWKLECLCSIRQRDGHSCSILALANIETQYTGVLVVYNPNNITTLKIDWLRRCVEHHNAAVSEAQQAKKLADMQKGKQWDKE